MKPIHSVLLATVGLTSLVTALIVVPSRSGHSSGGAVPVQVANPSTGPAQVQEVDSAGRQPFAQRLTVSFSSSGSGIGDFLVPAGKRMVITYASAQVFVNTGNKVRLGLTTTINGIAIQSGLPAEDQGVFDIGQTYSSSNPVSVTANPNTTVNFFMHDSDNSNAAGGYATVGIYGYLTTAS